MNDNANPSGKNRFRMFSLLSGKLAAFVSLSACAVALVFGPTAVQVIGEVTGGSSKRALDFATLGIKFEGASVCAGAACHGGGSQKAPTSREKALANASSVWSGKDKHQDAYKTLAKPSSAAIVKAMGHAGLATADETCLECHAVKGVTDQLKGTGFSLKEGNSCNSCHGPSEKWEKPHQTKGWTQTQRTAMDHDALLTTWGLYDTKPLTPRVELCTSCHLRIGSDLVAAGHPAPNFELGYFSEIEPRHWIAEPDFNGAKAWAIGQTVCLHEAMSQLATRASEAKPDAAAITSAYDQAASHLWVLKDAADAFGLDSAALTAHAGKLKDLLAKPVDNAAAIAAEATATSADAEADHVKVEAYEAKQADVVKAIAAIAADADLAGLLDPAAAKDRSFGAFGQNQQGFALFTLSKAYETGTKAAAPTTSDEVKKVLLAAYPKKPAMAPAAFAAALASVKPKLPVQ
jgi:hypothetical protein